MATKNSEDQKIALELPFRTIVKILLVILIVGIVKELAPVLMTLFLGVLLAVSLEPIAEWLGKRGLPKSLAILLLTLILALSIVAIGAMVLPRLFDELSNFINNLPTFKHQVLAYLEPSNPLRPFVEQNLSQQAMTPKPADMTPIFSLGNFALSGLTEIVLILVFAVYLVADGAAAIRWFSAFFSPVNQDRITQTADEISPIIFSYVAGQIVTSLLSFLYVLIALSLLGVPNALLLATLAGIFDVLPVLGFFLAVVPAILFALSVSPATALIVFFLYVFYHSIENYFIVPLVYGNRLRLSGFVVLVSLIAAYLLCGIEGAIAVLPIVAAYPVVERIWLKGIVGRATICDHATEE